MARKKTSGSKPQDLCGSGNATSAAARRRETRNASSCARSSRARTTRPPLHLLPLPLLLLLLLRVPPGIRSRATTKLRDDSVLMENRVIFELRAAIGIISALCAQQLRVQEKLQVEKYQERRQPPPAPGELRCLARLGETTLRLCHFQKESTLL
ncbi:unnamed protein product [Trichogramma brassicae]|uniref:Uncharacterized protein n=1 Tax=Trichogramma brassicae TaxID=86971 RepID=A0A6H5I2A3_9HYME|nr:unnamed protein product [Trichogramma brassicae]